MTSALRIIMAAAFSLIFPVVVLAETVTVAVASNFLATARGIAQDWSAETGHELRLIPGASGKHAAMILNGGPVDLFLSADADRPEALDAAGLVRRRATYALGALVVWAPGSGDPMARLLSGDYRRLAVANPALAPYGLAASEALATLGLDDAVSRQVVGENIGQTFGFVVTGNADLGLVALAQVLDFEGAAPQDWTRLDDTLYAPIRQDMVLLSDSPAAAAFFDHMLAPAVQARLVEAGYSVPAP